MHRTNDGITTTIYKYRGSNKNRWVKILNKYKYSDGSHLVGRAKQLNVRWLFMAQPSRFFNKQQFSRMQHGRAHLINEINTYATVSQRFNNERRLNGCATVGRLVRRVPVSVASEHSTHFHRFSRRQPNTHNNTTVTSTTSKTLDGR